MHYHFSNRSSRCNDARFMFILKIEIIMQFNSIALLLTYQGLFMVYVIFSGVVLVYGHIPKEEKKK